MQLRQNEDESLRLLLAQRRLYSRAKRYLSARLNGMIIIGIGAPLVSLIWQEAAFLTGAIAGIWVFLSRTWLSARERLLKGQAAYVQERFDFRVFAMPEAANRIIKVSPEKIALETAEINDLHQVAQDQHVFDWYPINPEDPGAVSVAISQRANASYSDQLLGKTAFAWTACMSIWAMVLIVACTIIGLSLSDFLIGIFLPLLPAALDISDFRSSVRKAAGEQRELASAIQRRLEDRKTTIQPGELQVWQDRLFEIRSTSPLVPDKLYWGSRNKNEAAMHSASSGFRRRETQSEE
ncbi:hypothetical protein J3362_19340 [Marinobacter sp. NFXS11]|uniref:S-4TM family putative pore-forming effector n=1 Tax=Marinobacter sp. NFXS11 TaxID=2818432 RepID=UPI0032DE5C81